MDLKDFLCWTVAPLLLLLPCACQSMYAHILNEEPVHVIPGSSLVLQARIEHGPLEEISTVTWEREPETGRNPVKVTLATCSGKGLRCSGKSPGDRVSAEQQGATLKLDGYTRADGGVYSVTVTDQTGAKTTAQCIVREYGHGAPQLDRRLQLLLREAGIVLGELLPLLTAFTTPQPGIKPMIFKL
ncbi:uncharacterized protein ACJ7VT_020393 [Polymixia lowei]